MPLVPILMPQLGESIVEATIMSLKVKPGDNVAADQEVLEVETNKAVMGVTTTCGGVIREMRAKEGQTVPVGYVLGLIEATAEEMERTGSKEWSAEQASPPQDASKEPQKDDGAHFKTEGEFVEHTHAARASSGGLPVPTRRRGPQYLSPRIRSRMDDLGITEADLAYITGSGAGGRVTINDFENFISYVDGWPSKQASPMRMAVAGSMQRTWRRPIASASRPILMAPIMMHRKRHPRKPGYTLYFARAFALALAEAPESAGYMVGGKILTPRHIDLGIAVQVSDGVLVPVMRRLNESKLDDLIDEYNMIVAQARNRRLDDEHRGGGIATITNFGGFGLTNSTPMPLPSESLILGIGAVQKVPVWSDEVECFVPVEQAQMVASFDHRVVDGGDIGRLMQRIAFYIEHPELL